MQLSLKLDIKPLPKPIGYQDKILLIGSCFTEHISGRLAQHKFQVLQNPHGILFNPHSVANSLDAYLDGTQYKASDLFYLNETWNSWAHHSRFSHTSSTEALVLMNDSQEAAISFIRQADWVIITLGSAFQYFLKESNKPVANNHRAPGQWFEKKLLSSEEIVQQLKYALGKLFIVNPGVNVLFTISPVRHIRDGVVENNRSKARLIEAVHLLVEEYTRCHYFPAYELVIDILRDYRFYDVDFVHPNYLATEAVWEEFMKSCIAPDVLPAMERVKDIIIARNHRPRFPETEGHSRFRASYAAKIAALLCEYPFLNLKDELAYFQQ